MNTSIKIENLTINVESGQKLTPIPARLARVEPKPEPKYVLARSYTEALVAAEQLGFHPAEWTYLAGEHSCRGLRIRPCNLYVQKRFWGRADCGEFVKALVPSLGCALSDCPQVTT